MYSHAYPYDGCITTSRKYLLPWNYVESMTAMQRIQPHEYSIGTLTPADGILVA